MAVISVSIEKIKKDQFSTHSDLATIAKQVDSLLKAIIIDIQFIVELYYFVNDFVYVSQCYPQL